MNRCFVFPLHVRAIHSILLLVGFAFASSFAARAQVINVQFTDGNGSSALNGDTWSPTVSPLAYTGTTWTVTSSFGNISESNLPYSDSTVLSPDISTVGFTLTGISALANNDTSAPLHMFVVTEFSGGDMTLTINGLQNGQAYDIYLDSAFNGGDGSAFTIGSLPTEQTTGVNTGSSFQSGVNYVDFTNVVATANSIVVTIAPNGTGQNLGIINGFQIEEAPEPNSLALIGMGAVALGLFAVFRRRQTA